MKEKKVYLILLFIIILEEKTNEMNVETMPYNFYNEFFSTTLDKKWAFLQEKLEKKNDEKREGNEFIKSQDESVTFAYINPSGLSWHCVCMYK